MLDKNDIKMLRNSVLFQDVPLVLLDDLLVNGSKRKLARGETLFVQGDPATCLYVVLSGWIKLGRLTPAGEDIVVAVYTKGESFGEAAALMGGTYPVTVEAAEDSVVYQITARTVADAIRTNPELAMAMLAATFRHNHELVLEIEDMKGHTAAQRLATFLVALAPVARGSCTFTLPYDKGLIAARLGMKPESLSRSFANLRSDGVTVQRGNVSVDDLDILKEFITAERSTKPKSLPNC
ncbi:MAG: Crp/Fnr family transcriptional regulator [Rhodobacteraceae bacterium]|nr:Crp/Fnr family transcriptional regulator [Paracoccaceae bacterium]